MKKIILVLLAVFMYGFAAEAQRPQRPQRERMDPEKMVEMRTEQMVKKYNLSEEQASKLLALNKSQAEKMKAMQPKPLPKDSLDAMSKAARKEYKKQQKAQCEEMQKVREQNEADFEVELKKILTSEQFAQYQKDEQARKERMENRRRGGNMGGPRGGDGWGRGGVDFGDDF